MKKTFAEIFYNQISKTHNKVILGLILFALFLVNFSPVDASSFFAPVAISAMPRLSPPTRNVQNSYNSQGVAPNIRIPGLRHIFTNPQVMQSMNMMPIPDSITIQAVSGAAGVSTRVYVLNQDLLNNITDNGSGANSITYVYQDTFAGRLVSNLLAADRAAMGASCFGVAVRMIVTASGAGSPNGVGASAPKFLTYDAFGNGLPLNMNMTSNQTRMDQDTSIEVVPVAQNLGRFVQYSFVLPVLTTATITLYLTPNFNL